MSHLTLPIRSSGSATGSELSSNNIAGRSHTERSDGNRPGWRESQHTEHMNAQVDIEIADQSK
jgi:hypothetical protein